MPATKKKHTTITFDVKCEVCNENLGGGYTADEDSILATAQEHIVEHIDADEADEEDI